MTQVFEWLSRGDGGQAPAHVGLGAPVFQWLGQLGQGPGGVSASCSNCGGQVCWWCWASPDFVACKEQCERNNPGNQAAIDACVCSNCVNDALCGGVGTRQRAYPWRQYSNETCIHQREVNEQLRAINYQPIGEDCKLGPRTCGASNFLFQRGVTSVGIPDTCFEHEGEWINPEPAGQPPPPDCRTNPSLCSGTQSCDDTTGECFDDCRKADIAFCGPGRTCDQSTGNCVEAPPPAVRKAGMGGGVVLLALAALAAIAAAIAGRGGVT